MKIYSYISTCNKAIIRETVKLYFTNATDIQKKKKKMVVIATYTHLISFEIKIIETP